MQVGARRSPGDGLDGCAPEQWSPAANTRPRVGDTTGHYARPGTPATAFPTALVDNVWSTRRVAGTLWGQRWGERRSILQNPPVTWGFVVWRTVEKNFSTPPLLVFRAWRQWDSPSKRLRQADLSTPLSTFPTGVDNFCGELSRIWGRRS
ncbi:hypothetical protein GCM10007073_12970 [Micrococcus flavus]|nr:hypothetical protein GCM10007073_12970 [Micrococcus flavus]